MKTTDMHIAFTGSLDAYMRQEAEMLVEAYGANTRSNIDFKTTHLVVGKHTGSKLHKAQSAGVRIWTEDEFYDWLKEQREKCISNA